VVVRFLHSVKKKSFFIIFCNSARNAVRNKEMRYCLINACETSLSQRGLPTFSCKVYIIIEHIQNIGVELMIKSFACIMLVLLLLSTAIALPPSPYNIEAVMERSTWDDPNAALFQIVPVNGFSDEEDDFATVNEALSYEPPPLIPDSHIYKSMSLQYPPSPASPAPSPQQEITRYS
jgi:hypothetical protein